MTELSPPAQAVLEAYWRAVLDPMSSQTRPGGALVAAALRAAADQLSYSHGSWVGKSAIIDEDKLLAIAAELEGGQSTSSTH